MRHNTSKMTAALAIGLALGIASTGATAEGKKMQLLKPADAPCLYLLDDEGNETSTIANAPCSVNGTVVNPGDPNTAPTRATNAMGDSRAATRPRDAASGMATGKRQH